MLFRSIRFPVAVVTDEVADHLPVLLVGHYGYAVSAADGLDLTHLQGGRLVGPSLALDGDELPVDAGDDIGDAAAPIAMRGGEEVIDLLLAQHFGHVIFDLPFRGLGHGLLLGYLRF